MADQPPAPRPALPPGKIRPGRVWYLLALLLVAGGVAWAVGSFISFGNQVNSLQRVPLPQGGRVNLAHSGGYVLYYEGPGAQSGHFPSFNVRVVPASPGAAVASLRQYVGTVTYAVGGHDGRAVLSLQVTHPGKFTIVAAGPANGSDLAFGPSVASSIVKIVVPSVLLFLLGVALGLVILVVRIVRRSRQRAQLAPGYYP
jgi:hypothetical protein